MRYQLILGAYSSVGPGLQIFGLITLPLVRCWSELKSLRAQSVGKVSVY